MGIHDPITTMLSTKGQVILPKSIRDARHWTPGTRLSVEDTPEGVLLKSTPLFPESSVDNLFGSLRYDGPSLSPEAMDDAVAAEARRRARD